MKRHGNLLLQWDGFDGGGYDEWGGDLFEGPGSFDPTTGDLGGIPDPVTTIEPGGDIAGIDDPGDFGILPGFDNGDAEGITDSLGSVFDLPDVPTPADIPSGSDPAIGGSETNNGTGGTVFGEIGSVVGGVFGGLADLLNKANKGVGSQGSSGTHPGSPSAPVNNPTATPAFGDVVIGGNSFPLWLIAIAVIGFLFWKKG
jgi:hypothetical protein